MSVSTLLIRHLVLRAYALRAFYALARKHTKRGQLRSEMCEKFHGIYSNKYVVFGVYFDPMKFTGGDAVLCNRTKRHVL